MVETRGAHGSEGSYSASEEERSDMEAMQLEMSDAISVLSKGSRTSIVESVLGKAPSSTGSKKKRRDQTGKSRREDQRKETVRDATGNKGSSKTIQDNKGSSSTTKTWNFFFSIPGWFAQY